MLQVQIWYHTILFTRSFCVFVCLVMEKLEEKKPYCVLQKQTKNKQTILIPPLQAALLQIRVHRVAHRLVTHLSWLQAPLAADNSLALCLNAHSFRPALVRPFQGNRIRN